MRKGLPPAAVGKMCEVLGVSVRHVPHLRRLAFLNVTDPALPRWANFCRAYGTGGHPVHEAGYPEIPGLKPILRLSGFPLD
jgi:hypothetical protein